jgi:hypothetical protein
MMKIKKYLSLLAVILLLVLSSPKPSSAQCAMCRRIAETNMDNNSNKVGKGLNKGILYMMSIPYILGAAGGIIWYRNRKKIEKGKVQ